MSKYNVGDAFAIEIKEIHKDELYKDANGNYYTEQCLDGFERIKEIHDFEEPEEMKKKAFKEGMNAAWDIASRIVEDPSNGGLSVKETEKLFGVERMVSVFRYYTPTQAMKIIEEYEAVKDIREGDVVEILEANAVVLAVDLLNEIATVYVLDDEHAKVQEVPLHQLKKTGNSIDVLHVLSRACVKEFAKGSAD